VRIVSLLPSATETLFALGLGDEVVAVTHECDHPPEARSRQVVTRPALDLAGASSAGVELAVSLAARESRSLYDVDATAILGLEPDLVVAQDVCDVCAIPAGQVEAALAGVPMLRQHPHSLGDVLADIDALGRACGADTTPFLESLRARIDSARARAASLGRVRGVFLEWIDPPYPAGHWTPDLLTMAGIDDPLARPRLPSSALAWDAVREARPELLVLAPCGFDEPRTRREAGALRAEIAATGAREVMVMDGSAYFNRPGPRLVDSLELLVERRAAFQER
jgi:iron complex transport system substrate-binding protein